MTYMGTTRPSSPITGMVRYDSVSNNVEVFDGTSWTPLQAVSPQYMDKKLTCENLKFGSITFYKVVVEGYDFDELYNWSVETFGKPRTDPDPYNKHKWFISGGEFYFHEAKHREWFVLKWS